MTFGLGHLAESLERDQTGTDLGDGRSAAGHHERRHAGQVRSDPAQHLAFGRRFTHQPDVALGEVAQTAVDHLGAAARGPRRHVPSLDEGDSQTTKCGVAGDAGSGDARTDDHHVELLCRQPCERGRAVPEVEGPVDPLLGCPVRLAARVRDVIHQPQPYAHEDACGIAAGA